ncbi:hypothetical protein C8R46DRAFT_1348809 [Mycena filopes]|nr:hypothetical protein C8R46DRAFT_1348809 [Mycena filopes]
MIQSLGGTAPTGLRNASGVRCFTHAILQCVLAILPVQLALEEHECNEGAGDGCVLCLLRHILVAMMFHAPLGDELEAKLVASLGSICPNMDPRRQQDAQEYLVSLLEKMNQTWGAATPENPIAVIFRGREVSSVVCSECGSLSTSHADLRCICLALASTTTTLEGALVNFTKEETLSGGDAYQCSTCKKLVQATKKIQIEVPPLVLLIQLKRFLYDQRGEVASKLEQEVQFPTTLDVGEYLAASPGSPVLYDLFGIVFHIGASTASGHYFACVQKNATWHRYNDDMVEEIAGPPTNDAYILMYAKHE